MNRPAAALLTLILAAPCWAGPQEEAAPPRAAEVPMTGAAAPAALPGALAAPAVSVLPAADGSAVAAPQAGVSAAAAEAAPAAAEQARVAGQTAAAATAVAAAAKQDEGGEQADAATVARWHQLFDNFRDEDGVGHGPVRMDGGELDFVYTRPISTVQNYWGKGYWGPGVGVLHSRRVVFEARTEKDLAAMNAAARALTLPRQPGVKHAYVVRQSGYERALGVTLYGSREGVDALAERVRLEAKRLNVLAANKRARVLMGATALLGALLAAAVFLAPLLAAGAAGAEVTLIAGFNAFDLGSSEADAIPTYAELGYTRGLAVTIAALAGLTAATVFGAAPWLLLALSAVASAAALIAGWGVLHRLREQRDAQ